MTTGQPFSASDVERRAARRRAGYRPFRRGATEIQAARTQLVLSAVYANKGRVASCAECQDVIRRLWGLEVERREVSPVLHDLLAQGKLIQREGSRHLSDTASQELANQERLSIEVETTAYEQWERDVYQRWTLLDGEQLAQLRYDLTAWLQHIVKERSIEAGILLYPEHERFVTTLDDIRAMDIRFLPKRDSSLLVIRDEALSLFFDQMTKLQRHYFYDLVTTAYLLAVFTMDHTELDRVRGLTRGQRVYLDTNVVYSLLKLNGPQDYLDTRRILGHSFLLGFQVCITPWTLMETQKSVRRAWQKLATTASPQTTARLDPDSDTDQRFIDLFRRMQRELGISFEDFIHLHEHLERLLEIEGVVVNDEGCKMIDSDPSALDEQIAILESVRDGPDKARPLQEHDVKHRLLIERLRGSERRSFSNVGYLLLSNDHGVVRYARTNLGDEKAVPFALSLGKWSHIARALVPRTDDYDKSLENMHETLSLRQIGLMKPSDVVDAIGRINAEMSYPPTVAMRIFMDDALTGGEASVDLGSGSHASASKESQLEARVVELESKLRGLHRERSVEDSQRVREEGRAATQSSELERALDTERRRADELQRRFDRLQRRVRTDAYAAPARQGPDFAAASERMSGELRGLSERLKRQEAVVRWLVGTLIVLVGAAIVAVPVSTDFITGGWALAIDICACGAVLVGAVAWVFGRRQAGAIVTLIGVILSGIVSVHTIEISEHSAASVITQSSRTGQNNRGQESRLTVPKPVRSPLRGGHTPTGRSRR